MRLSYSVMTLMEELGTDQKISISSKFLAKEALERFVRCRFITLVDFQKKKTHMYYTCIYENENAHSVKLYLET